jgi:predicted MFS family arabinose efflux permease
MTQAQGPHSLQALQARDGERHRWLLLLSVMLGSMAAVMSSTILNVAIPDMSQHFTLGQSRVQWVTSGFMVAMTVSMLTTPWLLSRYGYRRVYEVCMWLLLGGGVVGGLANDFPLVMAARVAEGLAAGVVQPIPAIIILRAFASHEQGRASGLFGMGVVLAPAIGPSIGGVLVDVFGWRSIFFMVVPLAMVALWLSRRYVPTSAPGGVQADADSPGLDWIGLALASVSSLMLLNGLVQLRGDDTTVAVALLVLAGLGMVVFVVWQRHLLKPRRRVRTASSSRKTKSLRQARQVRRGPLMNLQVFGHRHFAMGALVSFTYGIALFGSTYLLPVYMQMGLGLSPSYIGAALLPAGILLAVTIASVGRLSHRMPPAHWVSWGLALLALSFALMPLVHPAAGLALLWILVILGRIGLGFILPSLNLGALRGLPKDLIPQASSVIGFVRMLGGAAGVSICAIVLEWRLAVYAHASSRLGSSGSADLRAFNETFVFLATMTALALLAAWKMAEPVAATAKD